MILLASIAFAFPNVGCSQAPPATKSEPPMTLAEARQYVDPEVRWTPPKIDPKQNGWDLMVKATNLIPKAKGLTLSAPGTFPKSNRTQESPAQLLGLINKPGEKDIVKRCQKALAAYKSALDAIREATSHPYWYAPGLSEDKVPAPFGAASETTFPVYAKIKDLCKTLVLSANLDMKLKNPQAAADDLLLCHKIADRMVESHKDLITLLVGYAADAIASRSIQTLCADPLMKMSDLKKLLGNYQERRMGTDLAETLKSEHDSHFVATIAGLKFPSKDVAFKYGHDEDISKKLLEGHPRPFDRRATIELGSKLFSKVVGRAMQPFGKKENLDNLGSGLQFGWPPDLLNYGDEDNKQQDLTPAQIDSYRTALAKVDNPIGRLMVSIMIPVFSEADQADGKAVANTRATKIILAIQIYVRETGNYPVSLGSLASAGILKSVPIDPFSTKAFRYDVKRKVLWSVGPNLKDDGGKDREGTMNGNDYVWPVDGVFPKSSNVIQIAPPPIGGPGGPPLK